MDNSSGDRRGMSRTRGRQQFGDGFHFLTARCFGNGTTATQFALTTSSGSASTSAAESSGVTSCTILWAVHSSLREELPVDTQRRANFQVVAAAHRRQEFGVHRAHQAFVAVVVDQHFGDGIAHQLQDSGAIDQAAGVVAIGRGHAQTNQTLHRNLLNIE